MWVQCVSEGQINDPPQEGTGSAESSLSEPSLLAEGIPENLGLEWRILHPFEIPGVRFPTDNTAPNQRRLAENDALVETYSNHKIARGYTDMGTERLPILPPRYGDPFYRGRGRGRREWLGERLFERETNQGFGRGSSHGNGRRFYSKASLREKSEIGRRNGQFLQVMEGEGERFLFLPCNTRIAT